MGTWANCCSIRCILSSLPSYPSLLLSDVIADNVASIASGPTIPSSSHSQQSSRSKIWSHNITWNPHYPNKSYKHSCTSMKRMLISFRCSTMKGEAKVVAGMLYVAMAKYLLHQWQGKRRKTCRFVFHVFNHKSPTQLLYHCHTSSEPFNYIPVSWVERIKNRPWQQHSLLSKSKYVES